MNAKLKTGFDALLMAMSLMTRIPVSHYLPKQWQEQTIGYSALWYPFVGAFLALCLWLISLLLPNTFSPWAVSIVMVSLWVFITGALHLDGLADCTDAIYAGHKAVDNDAKKIKMLAVLKDPASGPMAVVSLVLLLLFKVILLAQLIEQTVVLLNVSLFVTLVLSRSLALLLIINTPYARDQGIGHTLASYTPKLSAYLMVFLVIIIASFCLPLALVIGLVIILLGILYLWRRLWLRAVGGFVGDAIGALVEISEVAILFVIYYYVSLINLL